MSNISGSVSFCYETYVSQCIIDLGTLESLRHHCRVRQTEVVEKERASAPDGLQSAAQSTSSQKGDL